MVRYIRRGLEMSAKNKSKKKSIQQCTSSFQEKHSKTKKKTSVKNLLPVSKMGLKRINFPNELPLSETCT